MDLYSPSINHTNMWAVKRTVRDHGYWFTYDQLRKEGLSKTESVWTLWVVKHMK